MYIVVGVHVYMCTCVHVYMVYMCTWCTWCTCVHGVHGVHGVHEGKANKWHVHVHVHLHAQYSCVYMYMYMYKPKWCMHTCICTHAQFFTLHIQNWKHHMCHLATHSPATINNTINKTRSAHFHLLSSVQGSREGLKYVAGFFKAKAKLDAMMASRSRGAQSLYVVY